MQEINNPATEEQMQAVNDLATKLALDGANPDGTFDTARLDGILQQLRMMNKKSKHNHARTLRAKARITKRKNKR